MAGWIVFLQNNIRLLKYSGFVMRSYDAFTASVTGVLQPRFQGLILCPYLQGVIQSVIIACVRRTNIFWCIRKHKNVVKKLIPLMV